MTEGKHMSTKADILKRLAELGDNDIVAVPVIRTKAEAEDVYEYSENKSIILTDYEWRDVVADYENAEHYDDEALVESIKMITQ
jgi:hypothetical protein